MRYLKKIKTLNIKTEEEFEVLNESYLRLLKAQEIKLTDIDLSTLPWSIRFSLKPILTLSNIVEQFVDLYKKKLDAYSITRLTLTKSNSIKITTEEDYNTLIDLLENTDEGEPNEMLKSAAEAYKKVIG